MPKVSKRQLSARTLLRRTADETQQLFFNQPPGGDPGTNSGSKTDSVGGCGLNLTLGLIYLPIKITVGAV